MFSIFIKKKLKYDWLVVGLGNPGEKYYKTRHNIGWMVAEKLAKKNNVKFSGSTIYELASVNIATLDVLIALPTTYMNKSGEAVSKLINRYHIDPGKMIVIIDEYNFPLGKIHVKDNGGDGGHNGMASVIDEIGDFLFYRMRCGIGKNFGPGQLVDYVLSDFDSEEIASRDKMITDAYNSIEHLIRLNNPNRAMSEINSGKIFSE